MQMDRTEVWLWWHGSLEWTTGFSSLGYLYTTLQATPGQLVFGRDMLLNLKFVADWEAIKLRKQRDVDKNNSRENSLRIHHDYQVGDKVLITSNDIHRKLSCPTKGPYPIVQVYSNGTVRVQNGAVTERINIRRCNPYTD